MAKVSIIIPSRAEKTENLRRTIQSIKENATGDYEIIVGLNGLPFPEMSFENVRVIKFAENIGIKPMVNLLASLATGKYLYKSDAHCSFSKGFDEILQQDMQDDWIVTPRFYVLDEKTWEWQDDRFYDYFYLSCPFTDKRGFRFKAGGHWPERTKERLPWQAPAVADLIGELRTNPEIDETPQIHGSGWFMTKDRFFELGGFPLQDPYGHGQEPLWLGLKNWLMGGKVMVNKQAWYAHLHQDSSQRGYPEDKAATEHTYNLTAEHFVGNKGHYLHDFSWFVDKFMPMPTWPENWRILYKQYLEKNT